MTTSAEPTGNQIEQDRNFHTGLTIIFTSLTTAAAAATAAALKSDIATVQTVLVSAFGTAAFSVATVSSGLNTLKAHLNHNAHQTAELVAERINNPPENNNKPKDPIV